jgi:hypothetical protein
VSRDKFPFTALATCSTAWHLLDGVGNVLQILVAAAAAPATTSLRGVLVRLAHRAALLVVLSS